MYSKKIETIFKRLKISIGDMVRVGDETGILMPRIDGNNDTIILKLSNGYNVGITHVPKMKIEKISPGKKFDFPRPVKHSIDRSKPKVLVISTGGTIVAKLDYRTGAVSAGMTSDDLVQSMPELRTIANISVETVSAIDSANMTPDIWEKLIKAVIKNKDAYDGIVITHGTDTMHYTSAALSFALRGIKIPVVLVGAQRSSDRGSSDAHMNFICAMRYASSGKPGVFVCMHETLNDTSCVIIAGTKARKMHTSRRDAFRSINREPVARIVGDDITYIHQLIHFPEDFFAKFERKVAMVKVYPGFDPKIIESYIKLGYRGLVIEGTGLGHTNINLLGVLEKCRKNNILVAMTSQCINGMVNMKVYELGRDLMKAGVVESFDMTPECAYVKMMWVLGQTKNIEKAKMLFQENIVGEIEKRVVE